MVMHPILAERGRVPAPRRRATALRALAEVPDARGARAIAPALAWMRADTPDRLDSGCLAA
ncbi:hypothetical protein GCM10010968_04650 [Agrococcus terreus]|uniref:HEAT repeat domain-containing protein n=1 Tax=Agrococcus terreus TaxID=574649 RepID=A0ABQ2KCL0_9MICO|nr:hypothetical protein GCM10010968_04650 [Agrococcus terreus]